MAPLTRTCPLKSRGHGTRRTSVVFKARPGPNAKRADPCSLSISAKYLRDALGINGVRMNRVLANLLNNGAINRYPHPHNNRIEMTYCLSPKFKEWLNSNDPVPSAPEADVNGT